MFDIIISFITLVAVIGLLIFFIASDFSYLYLVATICLIVAAVITIVSDCIVYYYNKKNKENKNVK